MFKDYGPDEEWKQIPRMLLVIAVVLALLIGLGMLLDEGESIGPCEQYTSQEAFELCADSVYNG